MIHSFKKTLFKFMTLCCSLTLLCQSLSSAPCYDEDCFIPCPRPTLSMREKAIMIGSAAGAGIIAGIVAGTSSGRDGHRGRRGPTGSSGSDIEIGTSPAPLNFTFDPNVQITATGSFILDVVFPDQTVQSITGAIGAVSMPVSILVNAPSQVGSYTIAYRLTTLSGVLNQGATLMITNGLTGDVTTFQFVAQTVVGNEDTRVYVNEPILL